MTPFLVISDGCCQKTLIDEMLVPIALTLVGGPDGSETKWSTKESLIDVANFMQHITHEVLMTVG